MSKMLETLCTFETNLEILQTCQIRQNKILILYSSIKAIVDAILLLSTS